MSFGLPQQVDAGAERTAGLYVAAPVTSLGRDQRVMTLGRAFGSGLFFVANGEQPATPVRHCRLLTAGDVVASICLPDPTLRPGSGSAALSLLSPGPWWSSIKGSRHCGPGLSGDDA
jgi:hypothetical protein